MQQQYSLDSKNHWVFDIRKELLSFWHGIGDLITPTDSRQIVGDGAWSLDIKAFPLVVLSCGHGSTTKKIY